jgi:hypothetical protein
MRPDRAAVVSSTSRTTPPGTIRRDFGFDRLGRQGRHSGRSFLGEGVVNGDLN